MAEEIQKRQDDESSRELYRERIKRFPNVMEEAIEKTKDVWSSLYTQVEDSLNTDIFGLEDEICRKNVKVFILWKLNERIQAKELANEVREKKPDNLVALTNLAFIHLYNGNISEVENLLDNLSNLEKIETFSLIEAEGKKNVAYCLTKVSFEDYERAIKLYKETLSVCPDDYWSLFSIALLQYRCLRKSIDKEKQNKDIKESIQYLEKIRCAFDHHIVKVDKVLMGRTLALLGLFQNSPYNFCKQPCEEYFQRALHISPDDYYVLEKCANYYMLKHQIEKAVTLFAKAIEIRETSYSHHQLGLVYLRMDEPKYTYFPVNKNLSKEANEFAKFLKYVKNIPNRKRNEFVIKAEYHFEQSLKISSDNHSACYDIILLYMSLKEYDNARKYCEKYKPRIKLQEVNFNILFAKLNLMQADEINDDEEKDQLRRSGMDKFVLALKSAVEFFPLDKDLIEIWMIKDIIFDLYKYGNENTEYKKFVLGYIHSVEDLSNDKDLQNILQENGL